MKDCVALTFPAYQSSAALEELLARKDAHHVVEEALIYYPEVRYWADYYVSMGTKVYAKDFAEAWTKLMNADRFQGPLGNVCA